MFPLRFSIWGFSPPLAVLRQQRNNQNVWRTCNFSSNVGKQSHDQLQSSDWILVTGIPKMIKHHQIKVCCFPVSLAKRPNNISQKHGSAALLKMLLYVSPLDPNITASDCLNTSRRDNKQHGAEGVTVNTNSNSALILHFFCLCCSFIWSIYRLFFLHTVLIAFLCL